MQIQTSRGRHPSISWWIAAYTLYPERCFRYSQELATFKNNPPSVFIKTKHTCKDEQDPCGHQELETRKSFLQISYYFVLLQSKSSLLRQILLLIGGSPVTWCNRSSCICAYFSHWTALIFLFFIQHLFFEPLQQIFNKIFQLF